METETTFNIELEHVNAGEDFHVFRVAFSGAESRILLPYPKVTGIRLVGDSGEDIAKWRTEFLVSEPLDDFVLMPGARIAFDLRAYINCASTLKRRWTISMPLGTCRTRYRYHVDDKRDWYDFLAKRSRFARITTPWNGTIESEAIEFANRIPCAEVG